ncbi:hypothetical protein [uncultured Vagococcus sp.]|uniref:hypothetical protein n=1 Tax=uncultured Vagococcus sp. TaxID=189676 RepID=UPI0028D44176|nr:hypothetical protein [uncultured Vagococcus sp.]
MRYKPLTVKLLMKGMMCLVILLVPVTAKGQSAVSSAIVEVENNETTSQSVSEMPTKQTKPLPQTNEKPVENILLILLGGWLILLSSKKLLKK